ncbi:MAG TPA: hypothetical protein VIS48_05605 [Candidatus Kryptonia bacterium]
MANVTFKYGGKDIALLQYLEDRLKANPSSSLFAMLAYFYVEIDRVGEALSVAQRGVIAHPAYSTGHVVLAMAMMKAGLFTDAHRELLKAADLHPGSKIVEWVSSDFESRAQADLIGKKLAVQFRRTSADPDIMKKVGETLKRNALRKNENDFLIPGLDTIVGDDLSKVQKRFTDSLSKLGVQLPQPRRPKSEPLKNRTGSSIAKSIIDKVSRESDAQPGAEEVPKAVVEPEKPEPGPGEGDFDLDTLARELVAAGPIRSDKSPVDEAGPRDESSGIELSPEIVTDTLALIFEQQGQTKTAIEAYTILITKKPEKADFYKERIAALKSKTDAAH